MSRRSRKRKAAGERRWAGKVAVALLVIGVIAFGGIYAAVRSYLHSDAFRNFLSAEASDATGVSGQFAPFQWDGLAVDTDSFEATGEGIVTAVKADGLHTEVGLGGLRRGVWEVRGSSVRRLEVSIDATKEIKDSDFSVGKDRIKAAAKVKQRSWLPREAEVEDIDIRSIAATVILEQGLATASDIQVHAEQSGAKGSYRCDVDGGRIRLPFGIVPELRLDRAQLRYQDKHVYLTKATVGAWKNGRIEADGEWDMETKKFAVQGEASGINCEDILSIDWAKRLTGDVTSGFTIGNHSGFTEASGDLAVRNGVLTALPMLDALAAYADTRRFRVLTLSEAHTGWHWKKGELSLTRLVLASEGLVRVEGRMIIRGQNMDGVFRLGLAPGTLSTIPGAETDVFIAGERGLLWAPVHITGTLDDPKEDLTDRLIEAAGLRMFDKIPETGEQVIKFTRSMLGDNPGDTIGKGVELIEKGSDTVRKVGGILDRILGTDVLPPDKEDP
jgi:hypothetical protein